MTNCRFQMWPKGANKIQVAFIANQTTIGGGQYSRKADETDKDFVSRVEKAAERDLMEHMAKKPDLPSQEMEDLCEAANSRQRR